LRAPRRAATPVMSVEFRTGACRTS
jgi:hypothetical protein